VGFPFGGSAMFAMFYPALLIAGGGEDQ
jgi:hypothetical protein